MKKILLSLFVIILLSLFLLPIDDIEARSGCCSWHGGVCTYKCPDGVNVGYMCCDGTSLSAKCAPYYSSCPAKSTPKCPSYSTYNSSSDSCECNYGYISSGDKCIDTDTFCQNKHGLHSSYNTSSKSCECDYGYKLIDSKCVKPEPVKEQPSVEEQSDEKIILEEEESDDEQLGEQPPASQDGLSASEKLTADISNEDSDRGFIWWIIGIGAAAYIFYALGKRKREK